MDGLRRLDFLLGHWKGQSTNQFGQSGTTDSTLECTREPGDEFIRIQGETRKKGRLLNRWDEYITFDSRIRRYISKRMWSMGFIENGEGTWRDANTLVFRIKFDREPPYFIGTMWKSFIRRYGENELGHGLYTAKKGGRFRLYGEAREKRVE
jgi:hypothetical protein